MNNLSWLIYLGDITGSLSALFGGFAFMCGVAAVVSVVIMFVTNEDDPAISATAKLAAKRMVIGIGIFSTLACIIPSKETVYLIAASEAGETVIKSETGQRAIDAVNRYLDSVGSGKKDNDND